MGALNTEDIKGADDSDGDKVLTTGREGADDKKVAVGKLAIDEIDEGIAGLAEGIEVGIDGIEEGTALLQR